MRDTRVPFFVSCLHKKKNNSERETYNIDNRWLKNIRDMWRALFPEYHRYASKSSDREVRLPYLRYEPLRNFADFNLLADVMHLHN